MTNKKEVVLILQIGSLGDTVISLPCYREIMRRHPEADRYLVTNFPIGSKMIPAEAILLPTGVIKGSIEYPMPLRQVGKMVQLYRQIIALKPVALYYLLPETKLSNLLRHYAFFKMCGILRIKGIPWRRDSRYSRTVVPGRLWESEASRLLRTITGRLGTPANEDRNLLILDKERAKADAVLWPVSRPTSFIAISVGGKVPLNDWGNDNWIALLRALSQRRPLLGAVFVGSADERSRNDFLCAHWKGPSLNTCGQLSPRETAALILRANVFLGHDTGTLHLAAAVNTPVIGIFSARNQPGVWFSDRARDTFFYDHVACAGCKLVQIEDCTHGRICMRSHKIEAVVAAVERILP